MTHGHEQWCVDSLRELRMLGGGEPQGEISMSIKHNSKKKKRRKIKKLLKKKSK